MAQTWDWFSSQSPDAPFAEKVMVAMGIKSLRAGLNVNVLKNS